jgi:hypothetical protein
LLPGLPQGYGRALSAQPKAGACACLGQVATAGRHNQERAAAAGGGDRKGPAGGLPGTGGPPKRASGVALARRVSCRRRGQPCTPACGMLHCNSDAGGPLWVRWPTARPGWRWAAIQPPPRCRRMPGVLGARRKASRKRHQTPRIWCGAPSVRLHCPSLRLLRRRSSDGLCMIAYL